MKNKNKRAIEIARMTFDWINTYLPTLKTNSRHTIKAYRTAINLYIKYLESKNITEQTLNMECFGVAFINDWLIWLKQERHSSNKTCNNRLAALKSLLKYIGIRIPAFKVLYWDAAASIPRLKESKTKVHGMTRAAVKTILSVPSPTNKVGLRDIAIMSFEYGTATRIDEVLSLKICNLQLAQDKAYATVLGKGDKIRTVYLIRGLVEILEKYIRVFHGVHPDPEDYLFFSSWHGSKSKLSQEAIRKRLKIYASKAHERCSEVPLDLHSHQWRHAKACHWLEDGINIVEISKLLGHVNLETTMIYQDITTEQQKKALATLEDESTGAIPKKWKLDENKGLSGLFRFATA